MLALVLVAVSGCPGDGGEPRPLPDAGADLLAPLDAVEVTVADVAPDPGPPDEGPADVPTPPPPLPVIAEPTMFEVAAGVTELTIQPAVAWGLNGDLAVAYTGAAEGANLGISFTLLDPAGAEKVAPFALSTQDLGGQNEPAVCALTGGGYAVAWSLSMDAAGPDGETLQIRHRRVGADGAPLDAEDVRLYTQHLGNHWLADVACAVDGGYAIAGVLPDPDGPAFRVFVQRFDGEGELLGEPQWVKDSSDGGQASPAIGLADDGRAVVAWEDTVDFGTPTETSRILASVVPLDGVAAAPFVVAEAGTSIATAKVSVHGPSGSFVAAGTVDGARIEARFFADGASAGSDISIPTVPNKISYNPALAATHLADRHFMLYLVGTGSSVFVRVALLGPEGVVDGPLSIATAKLPPYEPSLDYRDGRLAAAWTESLGDGSYALRVAVID